MGLRETAARTLLGVDVSELQEQARQAHVASVQAELFQERIIELENALDGWTMLGVDGQYDFSKTALDKIVRRARLMYLSNPLIRRAIDVQTNYVWGLGLTVSARHPDINDVVQAFWDDEDNQRELTSHEARTAKERTLQTDGNLFLVLFVNQSTGQVKLRSIPVEEIDGEIIYDPKDRRTPWFYKRTWKEREFDPGTGRLTLKDKVTYYPDWGYRPPQNQRPGQINGSDVAWGNPIFHRKRGGLDGMSFGVPEVYPVLDWASAYREALEDDATRSRSLARWAYRLTTPPRSVAAAKTRLGTTISTSNPVETNPPPGVGATFIGSENVGLEPVKLAGATLPTDHHRPLRLMVAAGTGTPDTILSGDPDMGNLATAKTLDRPTELQMRDRQTFWADTLKALLDYVVELAIVSTNGLLTALGSVAKDELGRDVLVLAVDPGTGEVIDPHVDVTFPDLLERDIEARVKAVVTAFTADGKTLLPFVPPKLFMREMFGALGIDDADEELDALFPEGEDGSEGGTQEAGKLFREALTVLQAKLSEPATNGVH